MNDEGFVCPRNMSAVHSINGISVDICFSTMPAVMCMKMYESWVEHDQPTKLSH